MFTIDWVPFSTASALPACAGSDAREGDIFAMLLQSELLNHNKGCPHVENPHICGHLAETWTHTRAHTFLCLNMFKPASIPKPCGLSEQDAFLVVFSPLFHISDFRKQKLVTKFRKGPVLTRLRLSEVAAPCWWDEITFWGTYHGIFCHEEIAFARPCDHRVKKIVDMWLHHNQRALTMCLRPAPRRTASFTTPVPRRTTHSAVKQTQKPVERARHSQSRQPSCATEKCSKSRSTSCIMVLSCWTGTSPARQYCGTSGCWASLEFQAAGRTVDELPWHLGRCSNASPPLVRARCRQRIVAPRPPEDLPRSCSRRNFPRETQVSNHASPVFRPQPRSETFVGARLQPAGGWRKRLSKACHKEHAFISRNVV